MKENKQNITKVINTYKNFEEIKSESYKWTNLKSKNTFAPYLWVGIIKDLLLKGMKINQIEKKYTDLSPKITKPSNQMYTNSLLKKLKLKNKQEVSKIRNIFSEELLEKWIVDRINEIYDDVYLSSTQKCQKWLDKWREHYKNTYEKPSNILKFDDNDLSNYLNFTKRQMKFKLIEENYKITNFKNITKIKLNEVNNLKDQILNNEIKKIIGDTGEKIFYNLLVKKYGFDDVEWTSKNISEYKPYDMKVTLKEKNKKRTLFYEIKSNSKNSYPRFFLSRNEYEFWKKNQENYRLVFVENISIKNLETLPEIKQIVSPKFEINLNYYGTNNGKIIISPKNFIGKI